MNILQVQKALLDAELELFTAQADGSDTSEIQKRVNSLTVECARQVSSIDCLPITMTEDKESSENIVSTYIDISNNQYVSQQLLANFRKDGLLFN